MEFSSKDLEFRLLDLCYDKKTLKIYFKECAFSLVTLAWPQLFNSWIERYPLDKSLSKINNRKLKTNYAIQRIEIYPVDSAIHFLNNWGMLVRQHLLTVREKTKVIKSIPEHD